MPRYTFPRVGDHPILAGLDPATLIDWRGAGSLLPTKKRNDYPIPDRRMHWGNQGSVASVVMETPHQGTFTPIIESSFDLAYSPLLEWRHGAGGIVFCQLDLTGRIGIEPAADRLTTNMISYLDSAELAGPAAAREVVFVGSDSADQTLLEQIGMRMRTASATALALQPTDLVVARPCPGGCRRARCGGRTHDAARATLVTPGGTRANAACREIRPTESAWIAPPWALRLPAQRRRRRSRAIDRCGDSAESLDCVPRDSSGTAGRSEPLAIRTEC